MFARTVSFLLKPDRAGEFTRLLNQDVIPVLRKQKGFEDGIMMRFRRKAVIPLWLVVFGLFALFGSSTTFATGVFVLLLGTLPLMIMLTLWKASPPAIAEVLRQVPSGVGNRSAGQASRGLGLQHGLRGCARGRSPML